MNNNFSLKKNTGKYLVNVSKGKLYLANEDLLTDVSYIVKDFSYLSKLPIDFDWDFIKCTGDMFIRKTCNDNITSEVACDKVVFEEYL